MRESGDKERDLARCVLALLPHGVKRKVDEIIRDIAYRAAAEPCFRSAYLMCCAHPNIAYLFTVTLGPYINSFNSSDGTLWCFRIASDQVLESLNQLSSSSNGKSDKLESDHTNQEHEDTTASSPLPTSITCEDDGLKPDQVFRDAIQNIMKFDKTPTIGRICAYLKNSNQRPPSDTFDYTDASRLYDELEKPKQSKLLEFISKHFIWKKGSALSNYIVVHIKRKRQNVTSSSRPMQHEPPDRNSTDTPLHRNLNSSPTYESTVIPLSDAECNILHEAIVHIFIMKDYPPSLSIQALCRNLEKQKSRTSDKLAPAHDILKKIPSNCRVKTFTQYLNGFFNIFEGRMLSLKPPDNNSKNAALTGNSNDHDKRAICAHKIIDQKNSETSMQEETSSVDMSESDDDKAWFGTSWPLPDQIEYTCTMVFSGASTHLQRFLSSADSQSPVLQTVEEAIQKICLFHSHNTCKVFLLKLLSDNTVKNKIAYFDNQVNLHSPEPTLMNNPPIIFSKKPTITAIESKRLIHNLLHDSFTGIPANRLSEADFDFYTFFWDDCRNNPSPNHKSNMKLSKKNGYKIGHPNLGPVDIMFDLVQAGCVKVMTVNHASTFLLAAGLSFFLTWPSSNNRSTLVSTLQEVLIGDAKIALVKAGMGVFLPAGVTCLSVALEPVVWLHS